MSLQALQKVVKYDINAVQKQKQIILDCLKVNFKDLLNLKIKII